jgi:hypothetical protein
MITFNFNQDYKFGSYTVQLTPMFATATVFIAGSPFEMIQVTDTANPGLTMNVPAKYLQSA